MPQNVATQSNASPLGALGVSLSQQSTGGKSSAGFAPGRLFTMSAHLDARDDVVRCTSFGSDRETESSHAPSAPVRSLVERTNIQQRRLSNHLTTQQGRRTSTITRSEWENNHCPTATRGLACIDWFATPEASVSLPALFSLPQSCRENRSSEYSIDAILDVG